MTIRVTLAPPVTREAFEDFAHGSGWLLYDAIAESDQQPFEEIWAIDGGASAAHYIEDRLMSVAFVLVMGEREAAVTAELIAGIQTVDAAMVLGWLTSATEAEDRMQAAVYLAATAAPVPDPAVVAAFARLVADPEPDVRRIAVFAASMPPWEELVALVESVAARDADPDVRRIAAESLQRARSMSDAS